MTPLHPAGRGAALWCSPTAPCSRARPSAPTAGSPAARWCSTPSCRATRRCSPTPATPARSSRSPTRTSATTAPTPPTTRRRRRSAGASSCGSWPGAESNWRADADLDDYLRRHGVPGIAGIDTRRLTRHIRDAGAMPGAFGTADEGDAQAGRGRRARHRRHRPGRHGRRTPEPYTVAATTGGRAGGSSPTTSASRPRSCATSPKLGDGRGRAGRRRSAADVARPQPRRGVPVQRPRRPRSRCPTPSRRSGACSARCRCSASAWATSCSARRPRRHAPRSCPSATTAATTRSATWRPARSRSPARTTTSPSSPTALGGRRRGHPRQPQRRQSLRGPRGLPRRRPAFIASSYHPEAGARPPRRRLPVRPASRDLMRQRTDAEARPTSNRSC